MCDFALKSVQGLYGVKWIVVILLVSGTIPAYSFDVNDIVTQQDTWHTGKDILAGDSFTYLVCDNSKHASCHVLRLDFHVQIPSGNEDTWVIGAQVSNENTTDHHIFLMDSQMDITTNYAGADAADSMQDTLFFLNQLAHRNAPKPLEVGKSWGNIITTLNRGDEMIVKSTDILHLQNGQSIDVFVAEYGFFETSTFAISRDLPFPASAIVYDPYSRLPDPGVIFAFEIIDYSKGGQG